MGRNIKIDATAAQRIGELYVEKGWSIPELAEEFGCCWATIRRALRDYGFPFYHERKLTRPIVKEVIHQYETGQYTMADLAVQYDVSVTTISLHLKKVGKRYHSLMHDTEFLIQRKLHRNYHPGGLRGQSEYIYEQYVKKLRPTTDISKELGVTREAICQILRRLGVNLQMFRKLRTFKKCDQRLKLAEPKGTAA